MVGLFASKELTCFGFLISLISINVSCFVTIVWGYIHTLNVVHNVCDYRNQ